jgi:transcriptional regulator
MYQLPQFIETREDVLHSLISAHPLGLLITHGPSGLLANAIPFLLEPGGTRLTAHLARANHQWKELAQATECLVVFQGPHAYVTPGWYATKAETGKVVPTWNYCMVQVRGRPTVHEDADWLHAQVTRLTNIHETTTAKPWAVTDAPESYIASQLRGIVGLEIAITAMDGKWKLSQNRTPQDREGVVAGYSAAGDTVMAGLVGKAISES